MSSATDVIELVRTVDPLDRAELARWVATAQPPNLGLDRPTPRPRRRAAKVAGGIVAAITVVGGVAAASGLLGGSPPPDVQQDLANVDDGMPADLRYNPDVAGARRVASSPRASLYLATLRDGGLLPRDRDRRSPSLGRDVHDPGTGFDAAARCHGAAAGVVRCAPRPRRARQRRPRLGTAHPLRRRLVGLDREGSTIASLAVPPLDDDDPTGTAHDDDQPMVVSTTSDDRDLTLVLGIEGRVNVSGVARLQLRYPDGTGEDIPMHADGTYDVDIATDSRSAFARQPGILRALDASGRVVATTPVASVAWWRAHTDG